MIGSGAECRHRIPMRHAQWRAPTGAKQKEWDGEAQAILAIPLIGPRQASVVCPATAGVNVGTATITKPGCTDALIQSLRIPLRAIK